MTALRHIAAPRANLVPAKCSVDVDWRSILEAIFPEKTAAWVASHARTSVRAAEHVLEGRNKLGGRALINLLRSPVGQRVLDAIAGDTDWRNQERRSLQLAELEQQLELKRRELADLATSRR